MSHPDFLARLSLGPDADERAVRRAYARELKLIDQERDLEGFQHLRACYEAALAWAERRAAVQVAPAPSEADAGTEIEAAADAEAQPAARPNQPAYGPAQAYAQVRVHAPVAPPPAARPQPPQAPQAPQAPTPYAIGSAVFEDFRARMPALSAPPSFWRRNEAASSDPWGAALREALADPRLLHLDARTTFEQHIAGLLAHGWQPRHHLLLAAAIQVFGWDGDRRALGRLGRPGAFLDDALEQRALIQSQDRAARLRQRKVLELLRAPKLPGKRTMRREIGVAAWMARQFPALMHIVVPANALAAWRERCPGAAAAPFSVSDAALGERRWWKPSFSWRGGLAVLIFLLLRVVIMSHVFDPQPSGAPAHKTGQASGPPRYPTEIYEDEPVTAERIEAIRKRIHYRPGNDVPPGEQRVEFQVVLDADGSILGLNKRVLPSDPAYAAAVAQAIRSTGPFPPKTSKSFLLGYHTIVPGRANAAPAPAWKKVAAPAWTAGPPGATPADRRGEPVSDERMEEIGKRIVYHHAKDAPAGEQRVRFQVVLDADGAIVGMSVTEAPADPAYAAAVERAIRASGPFPARTARTFSIGFHTIAPVKPPEAPTPEQDA